MSSIRPQPSTWLLAAFLAIAFLVLSIMVANREEPTFSDAWSVEMAGAFLSALAAVALALFVMQRTTSETASNIKAALRTDLEETIQVLERRGSGLKIELPDKTVELHANFLSSPILVEAGRHGFWATEVYRQIGRLLAKQESYDARLTVALTCLGNAALAATPPSLEANLQSLFIDPLHDERRKIAEAATQLLSAL